MRARDEGADEVLAASTRAPSAQGLAGRSWAALCNATAPATAVATTAAIISGLARMPSKVPDSDAEHVVSDDHDTGPFPGRRRRRAGVHSR